MKTLKQLHPNIFAVNSQYAPLKNASCFGTNYIALMECFADYCYGRGSWAPNSDYVGLNAANITRSEGVWQYLYLSIRNANIAIKNIPHGSKTTETQKAQFIGEAKFIRAFDYFTLVRSWGGVPLRTEENLGQVDIARSSVDDVYGLILSDLQYAEQSLPDVPRLIGTPSKWAAKTVLADVYLNLKKWSDACSKADEVIVSGTYSLVKVSIPNDFNKIYGPDIVTTSEEIFYLKYWGTDGWAFFAYPHHPGAASLYKPWGNNYYVMYTTTDNLVYKNWDNNDLRKTNNFYSWNIGLGSNSLLFKKYIDPTGYGSAGLGSNDYPLYRYADLLIIYAEAANNLNNGPTAKAIECLNKIHRRAYGTDPEVASAIDFKIGDYNAGSFLDLIIKEQGYETIFEGKRWLELVRTGKAAEIIKAVKGKDIAVKHYLFPIPVGETNYNKAIDPVANQNPGY
jgi:hypothetical protein